MIQNKEIIFYFKFIFFIFLFQKFDILKNYLTTIFNAYFKASMHLRHNSLFSLSSPTVS